MKRRTGEKVAALVVILGSVLVASAATGAEYDPCYEAYRESGLTSQQMSFDQFSHSYSDILCATAQSG